MNIYKNLSIITVVLFLLGILITVIYLLNLPSQIVSVLPALNAKTDQINGIFYNAYLIVGIELILGISAIVFLFLSAQKRDKANIVYVDKYATNREKEDAESQDNAEIQDHKEEIEGRVKAVKGILTGKKDLKTELDSALSYICNQVEACQGAIFLKNETDGKRVIRLFSSYAYSVAESSVLEYEFGEGLTGQAAKEGKLVKIDSVPDGYIKVFSGLGNSSPSKLIFIPIKNQEETIGVMEIAAFKAFSRTNQEFLKQLSPAISDYIGKKEIVTESN
ncbi:MAG TPA: GAF domain-containing protein [Cytophagales bacterium]|nr:GAF domain-containing protein [Cytophagales bacterium]